MSSTPFGRLFLICLTRSVTRSTTVREFSPLSIMAMPATISPSPSAPTPPCLTLAPVSISLLARFLSLAIHGDAVDDLALAVLVPRALPDGRARHYLAEVAHVDGHALFA